VGVIVSATQFDVAGTTAVARLGTASGVRWVDDIDDDGSFAFSIPAENLGTLAVGSVVRFSLGDASDDWVFAGTVEEVKIEKTGAQTGGAARIAEVSGRGLRARLADAIVYPVGSETSRSYTSRTPGYILDELIDEAQTRTALSGFTMGFSPTLDSNSAAYSDTLTLDVRVGSTLEEVVRTLEELAVDVWVTPEKVIEIANVRGTVRTTGVDPMVLRAGLSVSELSAVSAGPITNVVLVASGAEGATFTTETNAGSVGTFGRRETFLSLANTTDATVIDLSTEGILDRTAVAAESRTIKLEANGPLPYLDFEIGDTVFLADTDGSRTAFRVRALTVAVDDAGAISFVPELGTTRADLDRRLRRALAKAERNQAGGESGIGYDPIDIDPTPGAGGGLFEGEVLTYDDLLKTGTFDLDGGENFVNGTGFGLMVGDIVTAGLINGDYVAVSVKSRAGSYSPPITSNPQANNDFPADGDAPATQLNPLWEGATANAWSATTLVHPIRGFFATGVLGYAGRVVCMLGNRTLITQPTIAIYNVETGAVTDLNRVAAVGATNRTTALGVIGTRLFVTYDGTSGNCVESWESTTNTWSTHAISHAVYAGVSDGLAWWVGYSSGGTRYRVHSIDSSGTLSSIDYPTNITFASTATATATARVFARAKNGKIWADLDTTSASQVMAVADTNVAAASLSFTTFGTPGDLPWSTIGNGAGNTSYHTMGVALTQSDVDGDGSLYYLFRGGSPATRGFAYIDEATNTITRYGTITSATGAIADGEVGSVGGMCLAGDEVIIFGAIREDVADPGTGRTGSQVPCYWRTDGVTTSTNADVNYVGLSSGASGELSSTARVIVRDDISSTFVFLKNIAARPFGEAVPINSGLTAKDTGPSIIDALTI
jgi:hypothetical protein